MKSQASVIEELKNQMSKLTSTVGTLQQERGKFPSQPLTNPQHHFHQYTNASTSNPPPNHEQAKAITTLRSGRELVRPSNPFLSHAQQQQEENLESEEKIDEIEKEERKNEREEVREEVVLKNLTPVAPFPKRLVVKQKNHFHDEIYDMFKQVKVNIPLLDMIRQIPSHAKFLKDLCTVKRKLNVQKKVFLTEQVSSIL